MTLYTKGRQHRHCALMPGSSDQRCLPSMAHAVCVSSCRGRGPLPQNVLNPSMREGVSSCAIQLCWPFYVALAIDFLYLQNTQQHSTFYSAFSMNPVLGVKTVTKNLEKCFLLYSMNLSLVEKFIRSSKLLNHNSAHCSGISRYHRRLGELPGLWRVLWRGLQEWVGHFVRDTFGDASLFTRALSHRSVLSEASDWMNARSRRATCKISTRPETHNSNAAGICKMALHTKYRHRSSLWDNSECSSCWDCPCGESQDPSIS